MRNLLLRTAMVGAVVSSAVLALQGTAMATGASRTCPGFTCSIDASGFTGGQLAIDADTHGVGNANWTLYRKPALNRVCATDFPASAPPRSWVCNNLPSGSYVAVVTGPAGPTNIGVRW